ncbi:Calcium/calmodulin-dependent protein kinase type I [Gigaspora margarita]|uniref:Calcium/calmodulin-dependent protein kinase type I n=1 Tax=Gigaspora margarita TaxID=4874 RepID=A0A8H3XE83_GIGMA|nr:Calcium/calmodulin-dependent protein kinase type I [Gigaspora margarita]
MFLPPYVALQVTWHLKYIKGRVWQTCRSMGSWCDYVLFFILHFSFPPFDMEDDENNQTFMCENSEFAIAHNAKDFISKLLFIDPNKRLTAEQAL